MKQACFSYGKCLIVHEHRAQQAETREKIKNK